MPFRRTVPHRSADRRPVRRRAVLRVGVAIVALAVVAPGFAAAAEPDRFIRIGTGPIGGTYFPIGGLIANAISNPPGSAACELGGSCGVPGLIAASVASQGSIDNLQALAGGRVDLGLAQADVARDAYRGEGVFAGRPAMAELRSIGNLFPEAVHVAVRADAGIKGIAQLKQRRVSLGEPDSGTLATAKTVLGGFRLAPRDLTASFEKLTRATDRLARGEIDALFMVGGYPVEAIARLSDTLPIALLPIDGKPAEEILAQEPLLAPSVIPAGSYAGVKPTPTVGPRAQLLATARLPDELAYAITKALWHPGNRRLLDGGHPEGRNILLAQAVDGLVAPLHPGAARYYAEVGIQPVGPL
jgi:TRAP transporter TAXI family solute receptor